MAYPSLPTGDELQNVLDTLAHLALYLATYNVELKRAGFSAEEALELTANMQMILMNPNREAE